MSNGDRGDRSGGPAGPGTGADGIVDQVEEVVDDLSEAVGGAPDDAARAVEGAASDPDGGLVDEAGQVIGQRAISDALSRDDASVGEWGGLVSDEGDTLLEQVRAGRDAAGGLASSAQSVSDAARALVDAARSLGQSENVQLDFECEALSGTWTVTSAGLDERLNSPYLLTVQITTQSGESVVSADELLGESCRLSIERGSALRNVSGIISEVRQTHGVDSEYPSFSLTVVPAFMLLQQRVNSVIFQDLTVPQILEKVLTAGLDPYQRSLRLDLSRDYPVCEYRTQYDETDFNFCQRLMEEEGIYYWFEFEEEDGETMVLADQARQFGEVESTSGASLRFTSFSDAEGGHEAVTSFESVTALRPTALRLRHFDWTHPSAPIKSDSSSLTLERDLPERHGARLGPPREQYEHDLDALTLSDYSSGSYGAHDADEQLRLRREQQLVDAQVFTGSSSVVELRTGATFAFSNPPYGDADRRYLVLSAAHSYTDRSATNQFTCVPADTPFRPRRMTIKPRISSVQTAKVVGPAGQEIHTDQHGRIKVQFHWDRLGENDDHSSCYLRVMQPWAGAGWGFVFLPRIGMEVVVTFVNGDPDLPMVMGAVYNGELPPPYGLDGEKTKSVIKTQSTPGGGGYNELTFEDSAGEEQIIVHAQKDYDETVENDHSTTVHSNQRNAVDGSHSESVGGKQTLSVGGDRQVTIQGKQLVEVKGGESAQYVEGNYILGTSQEITAKAPDKISIKCGGSVITVEPHKITLSAGGGAILTLDTDAVLKSVQGSMVMLNQDSLTQSSARSAVQLTSNATVKAQAGASLELTNKGTLTAQGGGRVVTDGSLVKINC